MDAEEFARKLVAALNAEAGRLFDLSVVKWNADTMDEADALAARSTMLRDVARCVESVVGAVTPEEGKLFRALAYGAASPVAGSTAG